MFVAFFTASLFIIIPMLPFTSFETITFRLNIYVSRYYLHARAGSGLLPAMALVFIYYNIVSNTVFYKHHTSTPLSQSHFELIIFLL